MELLSLAIVVLTVAAAPETPGPGAAQLSADVCVVGGGSGGFSTALAAARAGADVILVERLRQLGGTSTAAYVSNWEPGPGDEFARELYDRLAKRPQAVGIVRDHNGDRRQGPFGLWLPSPELTYEQSLRRAGLARAEWRAVVFEPDALSEVVAEALEETHRCRLLMGTTFTGVAMQGNRLREVLARSDDGKRYRLQARVFVDCTGGAELCRAAGYQTMLGAEPADRFGEPSAPEQPMRTLNAISLCYRIRRSENPVRQSPPDPPVKRWPHSAHVSGLPCGDRIVNPLAMLPGTALLELGYDGALAECRRIASAHWYWLQSNPTFADYEWCSCASMLGIRESYRVVGEHVLTQHDLMNGLSGQPHRDVIAVADHAMDVHGEGSRRVHGELKEPYGIPYRCLVPKGSVNLLVACRGASFSHIAASSCRLSRTMIALGHAAGLAAAQAAEGNVPVGDVDVAALQSALGISVEKPQDASLPAAVAPETTMKGR